MITVENDFMKFWIEDGILHSQFKKSVIINIEKIKALIELRTQISNGEKQYWCYNFDGIKSYDKEARDYAEVNGQEDLYACAAVFNSHVAKYTLNTFMLLKKNTIPLKGFTKKNDAINWLNELKEKK